MVHAIPVCQPPTVALTVPAQLHDPQANETEMGPALFAKNGEGRNFDFDFLTARYPCELTIHIIEEMNLSLRRSSIVYFESFSFTLFKCIFASISSRHENFSLRSFQLLNFVIITLFGKSYFRRKINLF